MFHQDATEDGYAYEELKVIFKLKFGKLQLLKFKSCKQ